MATQDEVNDLKTKTKMLEDVIVGNKWSIVDGVMASSCIIIGAIGRMPPPHDERLAKDVAKMILEKVHIVADFEE